MKTRSMFLHDLASVLVTVAVVVLMGWSPAAAVAVEWHISSDPPSIVYVDDDFTEETNGWGVDHFDTIQAGVDAVSPGGSVLVAEGVYAGQIVINKDLTLQGDDQTSVIVYRNELPVCGANPDGERRSVICVRDDASVTIAGFTIQSDGTLPPDNNLSGITISNIGGLEEEDDVTIIHITDNLIEIPENFINNITMSTGIDVITGYDSNNIVVRVTHNEIRGFNQGLYFHLCNPAYGEICSTGNYENIEVISNNLISNGTGIKFAENISANAEIHFNRIYDYLYTYWPIGITVPPLVDGATVNAEYNWWGCNELMAYDGCVSLDIPFSGNVTYDPWLILTLDLPPAVAVNQTISISADLIHDSNFNDTSSDGTVKDGIEISFSADNGSIQHNTVGTVNGVAVNTYTAPAVGEKDRICVTLDAETSFIPQVCQNINIYPEPLELTALKLLISVNGTDWEEMNGSFAEGFSKLLDPSVEFYYLDAADLVTTHTLKDGLYPFYFGEVPAGFFEYWAGRGVVEGATGWQGVMWEIINGRQPVFYLNVSGSEYDLIDGLLYDPEQPHILPRLRIDGGYLPGAYTFTGEIADSYGLTALVTVGVEFYGPLALSDLDLLVSTDQSNWQAVAGDLAGGFAQHLDPAVGYYYLDAANLVTTNPLKDGLYPFYFGEVPVGFFEYWAGRGVVEGATGWQGVMWEIINKDLPVFYLKVAGSEYDLIDGLQYELGQTDARLRIDGGYLPGEYTFSGKIEDIYGFTDSLTVGITFNDIPVVKGLAVGTEEDKPVEISLSVSDLYHPEGLTWIVGDPQYGILSGTAPDLVYTPDADWYGTDSFTYQVSDGMDLPSNEAVVTITVNAVDDNPAAADDAYSTDEDRSMTVEAPGVLANDSDADGDELTTVLVSGPAHGNLTLNEDGSFTYEPEANWHGTDYFTYQASDGTGPLSNTATVAITVEPVNDPPVAAALPNVEWLARQAHTLIIPAFTDVDGDELTYTAKLEGDSDLPAWLSFDPATRTFTATPTNAHVGEYVIKVTASDDLEEVSASFTLKVILNPFIYYMPIIAR